MAGSLNAHQPVHGDENEHRPSHINPLFLIGNRYVFLHGFPKSDKANITQDEKKALQFAGRVFLELSTENRAKALQSGVLLEVHCEQDH